MAVLYSEDPREWSIRVAKQDASYLVTPTARRKALDTLEGDESPEARAAVVILEDGGTQQRNLLDNRQFQSAELNTWREAADLLGVFDKELGNE